MVFYAPVLFSSLGMGPGRRPAVISHHGRCVCGSNPSISILTVDTFGRRVGARLLECGTFTCTPITYILCACSHL